MGSVLEVVHTSRFRYVADVSASYNEARLTPTTIPGQLTFESELTVEPPGHTYRYWDYWGTLVHAFEVHLPHRELSVVARSIVETAPMVDGLASPGPGRATWDEVRCRQARDSYSEYLYPSAYVPFDRGTLPIARELESAGSPNEAALEAMKWVRGQLVYERGATEVHTTATEALAVGRGVCQDFSHLAIAVLRQLGIPARYASGYLPPARVAPIGERVAGESHAWVEAWLGDWVGMDPTNQSSVVDDHVLVARGRDYADVTPLKGVYNGGKLDRLEVTVEVARLG
ncbi:MAG: transglutaminase family protein [Acidimicrobiales bacterium]